MYIISECHRTKYNKCSCTNVYAVRRDVQCIAREVKSTKLFSVVTTKSYVNVEHARRSRTLSYVQLLACALTGRHFRRIKQKTQIKKVRYCGKYFSKLISCFVLLEIFFSFQVIPYSKSVKKRINYNFASAFK